MTDLPSQETIGSDAPGIHPNYKSYLMSSHGVAAAQSRGYTRRLQRITIYSVTRSEAYGESDGTTPDQFAPRKVIDTTLFKKCQYNPAELEVDLAYSPVAPEESEATGGNVNRGNLQLGLAGTKLDLLFSREQEVHAGKGAGSRFSGYRRLGVAKDIIEMYAVIMGDKELMQAGEDAQSLSAITGTMTDLVENGSPLLQGHRIAIAYSRDFVIYGYVTGISFRFVKFNHEMIPTMAYMALSVDIHNLANKSTVRSEFTTDTETTYSANTDVNSAGTEAERAGWNIPE